MPETVYIGHGPAIEVAYRLKHHLVQYFPKSEDNDEEPVKKLKPKGVFVIQEAAPGRLRWQVCTQAKDDVYDREKAKPLVLDFLELRLYLGSTEGDRVIATIDSLADKVDEIVKNMGYETVRFE